MIEHSFISIICFYSYYEENIQVTGGRRISHSILTWNPVWFFFLLLQSQKYAMGIK